jgi:osmotically-inducible protein OsmY
MNRNSSWSRDEPITAAIEREIPAKMRPNAPPISVAAQGATVTLTGHVANQATKDALNLIESDKTDHQAIHKGSALRKIRT